MLYVTCIMISSVDLAHYGVSRAKDWVSVNCGIVVQMFKQTSSLGICIGGRKGKGKGRGKSVDPDEGLYYLPFI